MTQVYEQGDRCNCCGAPLGASHSHRNCAKCDADDDNMESGGETTDTRRRTRQQQEDKD